MTKCDKGDQVKMLKVYENIRYMNESGTLNVMNKTEGEMKGSEYTCGQ